MLNSTGTAVGTQDMVLQHAAGGGSSAIMSLISDDEGCSGFFFGDMSDSSTLTDEDIGKLIYEHVDNSLRITVNTAEVMRIESDGKVGIGTNNPLYAMHLRGDTSDTDSATVLFIGDPGGNGVGGHITSLWENADAGYHFLSMGSSWYDGDNYITNGNSTAWGSNHVAQVELSTAGIKFYT